MPPKRWHPKATSRQTPRDTAEAGPRKARDRRGAFAEEPGESADDGRDLAHGEGGAIDLPSKPADLSKDD